VHATATNPFLNRRDTLNGRSEEIINLELTGKELVVNAFIATINAISHTTKGRLASEEKGATMVEYGIMVAFIAVLVMAAVLILGPQIAGLFTSVSAAI
jgi:pilus assembly protein Flp/PilA